MNKLEAGSTRVRLGQLAVLLLTTVFATSALAGNGKGNGGGGGGSDNGKAWGLTPGGGKNKCDPSPSAPTIDGLPQFSVIERMSYAFTPTASDANCDSLVFKVVNKPAWASFDPNTGSLIGTPELGSAGVYPNVTISVSDGTTTVSLPPFTIDVYANSAPVLLNTPPTYVVSGNTYDYVPEASDPDGQPLRYSVANKPAWAGFDSATGRLSGTPDRSQAGTYDRIVVSVTDGLDTSSTPEFSVTVEAVNGAPTISGSPSTRINEGQSYSFAPSASDPDGDKLSFSIQNPPTWARFDTATGLLSGTPSKTDAGSYSNIVITVSDGSLSSSLAAFGIEVVNVNGVPTIQGTPPGSVVVGQAYSFKPQASDPDGDPLTFSLGNAPGWVDFNTSTGQLSGSPQSADVGEYINITVAVSDGQAQATLGPFAISVEAIVNGTATLSWQPPTQRTDGSSLSDLAGYRILYGSAPGSYTNDVRLDNPGLTSYVVENLAQGTWYFAMTAIDSLGVESSPTNAVSKTVQ